VVVGQPTYALKISDFLVKHLHASSINAGEDDNNNTAADDKEIHSTHPSNHPSKYLRDSMKQLSIALASEYSTIPNARAHRNPFIRRVHKFGKLLIADDMLGHSRP
jgi:hypothetical protein